MQVPRLGARTFELSAGFLRIRGGDEPLDASSVHPEAYGLARKIVAACGRDLRSLMGDAKALKSLNPAQFVDERFGLPTVRDILGELEKPGRDPRPEFRTASFAEGVEEIADLKPGMVLEGTVTNVAAFGAFVDIGVHQDGLVHVSQLADRFVKDPREVVKAGDVVSCASWRWTSSASASRSPCARRTARRAPDPAAATAAARAATSAPSARIRRRRARWRPPSPRP